MPIQWHNSNAPVIASAATPATPHGRVQVPARGPGSYIFYVDHRPHDYRMLTLFASTPHVSAYAPNGKFLMNVPIRRDRYGDRNAFVWDVQRGVGVGYYQVSYQLDPRSVRACRPGTGFSAIAKWAPPMRR